ncbi:MAG: single-stranded DNA-binding protein [Clostridia bacterium]|nr:single-stranded DNA-binding protein [Clostridia bacterium]
MDNITSPIHFNRVKLCGQVLTEPVPSHINHGESFFRFFLSIPRLSGQCDELPVIVSRHCLEQTPIRTEETVCLTGQLRSFNNKNLGGPRLILSVFARQIARCPDAPPLNAVRLCGTICKTPTFRRTPLGREICDVILAVNRRYERADYLPCIAWGAVAEKTAALPVGSPFALEGRFQSRSYTKVLAEGTCQRTAYEVSVMRPISVDELSFDLM